ncbi:hypothetical protein GGF31_000647 [Allomyces arbusculus]|nr:hypothetical protein GGF31_000647 [Allomyces arbusculus]
MTTRHNAVKGKAPHIAKFYKELLDMVMDKAYKVIVTMDEPGLVFSKDIETKVKDVFGKVGIASTKVGMLQASICPKKVLNIMVLKAAAVSEAFL